MRQLDREEASIRLQLGTTFIPPHRSGLPNAIRDSSSVEASRGRWDRERFCALADDFVSVWGNLVVRSAGLLFSNRI